MLQRACSLILLMVFLVTGPVHAAANKKFPSSFNFLRLKSSTGARAPLVIEPGVLTPSSEDGAIEFDGNDLYITKSGVKTVLGSGGAKGDKGDKGDQGERGPRGLAGPSGPAGPTGSFSGGDAVVSGILSFSTGRLQNAVLNGTSLFRTNSIAKFNGSILIPASAANGKVLTSNGGGLASWKTLPTSTPGGSSGQIQINNSGSFAGNGSLFWDFTNKRLGVGTSIPAQAKLKVVIGSAAEQGLVLQAAASQTGNLTEWRNGNGTILATIDKSGNLGVGTSSPTSKLYVAGAASITGQLTVARNQWILDSTGTEIIYPGGELYLKGGGVVFRYTDNTELARFEGTSGNLGIGTASPGSQLQVNSRSASTKGLIVKGAASQTANLTEWQNSAGTVKAHISNGGAFTNNGGFASSEIFGRGASVSAGSSSVFGRSASATDLAVAIGSSASATQAGVTIGYGASGGSVCIGYTASCAANSIGLGRGVSTSAGGQLVFNNVSGTTDVYFSGVTGTVRNVTLQTVGATGTNTSGGHTILAGGKATGNAAGGDVIFQTSDAGASGSTIQALTAKMTVKASGNVGIGTASPARKLHISEAMRIEPQSSPPASASMGDLYVDSDTGSLCFYNGSAWTAVTAGGCS